MFYKKQFALALAVVLITAALTASIWTLIPAALTLVIGFLGVRRGQLHNKG